MHLRYLFSCVGIFFRVLKDLCLYTPSHGISQIREKMDNPGLIVALCILVILILVGLGAIYWFLRDDSPPPSTRYGTQKVLNLIDVYQDWTNTASRDPYEFTILPNSQIRVSYLDGGYMIGMASFIANYTVLNPTTLRLNTATVEKVYSKNPAPINYLQYSSDRELLYGDGTTSIRLSL